VDGLNEPVTKGDLIKGLDETTRTLADKIQKLDDKIEQIRTEVNSTYADIVERISDGETRLLISFLRFCPDQPEAHDRH
jgi:uncharacterized protein YlxW (UPF0749 family)